MKNCRLYKILPMSVILAFIALLSGCHDAPEYKNDNYGNFDALSNIIDTKYCFFGEKDINWKAVTAKYRAKIKPETNSVELFFICADMLDELKDGHVNLVSRFNTSYYRKWWSDYPQDFNLRSLQQYYLKFQYNTTSGMNYAIIGDSIGYIYYPSFSSGIGESSLDYVLAALYKCHGLIIDVRDNGGGLLTNVETLVSRFISKETSGGFITHKTGPAHDAFSEPYEIVYKPADNIRVKWRGNIAVLTNRSCFSAANNFVAVMKTLPNVKIIGARTGGGGGLPFSAELPNGWSVRFSASPMTDPDGNETETGIDPSEGFEVHDIDEELARGKDRILDTALRYLKELWDDEHIINADEL